VLLVAHADRQRHATTTTLVRIPEIVD
jgi:hypothetical protein